MTLTPGAVNALVARCERLDAIRRLERLADTHFADDAQFRAHLAALKRQAK